MALAVESDSSVPIAAVLGQAFAPWHARALGIAVGLTCTSVTAVVTAFHVVAAPPVAPNLALLGQYFYGYDVSWRGVLVGAGWSFVLGFVMGWLTAVLVNAFVAARLFVFKARADLSQTTDFLDHV